MGRAGNWACAYSVLCALVWAVGAVVVLADAPPLNPNREQLCAAFTTQRAPDTAYLPAEIGPLAQHGAPYWATWMPRFEPLDPALVDTYPSCLQDDAVMAAAQARLDQAWESWTSARRDAMLGLALAPLGFAPVFALLVWIFTRRSAAKAPGLRAARAPVRPRPMAPPPPPTPMEPQLERRRPLAPNAPPLRAQLRKSGTSDPSKAANDAAPRSPQRRNR